MSEHDDVEKVNCLIELLDRFDQDVERIIRKLPEFSAESLNLDRRCGRFWVDFDNRFLIARASMLGTIEYYGGLEYAADAKFLLGTNYVAWRGGEKSDGDMFSSRVLSHIQLVDPNYRIPEEPEEE